VAYAFVGLAGVLLVTRQVGFRAEESDQQRPSPWRLLVNFAELLLQSFIAAYVVLLLFGVVDIGDSLVSVVRLGLIQVVPLGLGAALSNRLLAESDNDIQEAVFPQNLSTFTLGAVFFAFPIAPTEEIELIAVNASWGRLAALVVFSILIVYLVLYELEFRGHDSRIQQRSSLAQVGTAFVIYTIGVVVSVGLLLPFGHFDGTSVAEWIQQTIVLAFIASTGASAGEVVL